MTRSIWLAVRIAAAISLVVVPFGYATTGVDGDILMGVGCGVAVGAGVGLRGGSGRGPWPGILIGSMVGGFTALIAGELPYDGLGFLIPLILSLTVGLVDGLGGSSLSGYRDVIRETFIASVLLALGLLPVAVLAPSPAPITTPLLYMPWMALVVGLLSHRREGWRDARPPGLLLLGAAVPPALMVLLFVFGNPQEARGLSGTAVFLVAARIAGASLVVLPVAGFLLGRAATIWLRPRLRVYGQLADYLRVMWIPIGGFAVGYLTIILLFAGFYGTLERFSPGAFAGAGTGIAGWVSFSFFTALGQDFTPVVPASVGAQVLVGIHLILSAGWALVLFAAVMSYVGPKLDRIARRRSDEGGD